MYMINTINITVCYIWHLIKRVNPRNSHHEEKIIFLFFLLLCIYKRWRMLTKLNVVTISWYKWNYYAAHLKLIQCWISIISQKKEDKKYSIRAKKLKINISSPNFLLLTFKLTFQVICMHLCLISFSWISTLLTIKDTDFSTENVQVFK